MKTRYRDYGPGDKIFLPKDTLYYTQPHRGEAWVEGRYKKGQVVTITYTFYELGEGTISFRSGEGKQREVTITQDILDINIIYWRNRP